MDFFSKSNSLFIGEAYKLLIDGKGFFILVGFFVLLAVTHKPVWEEYYISTDYYYEAYIEKLEGAVTEEKENYLKEEQQRFEQLLISFENGEISDEIYEYKMKGYEAFRRLIDEKLPYLQETGGYFIHETGYRILTGDGIFQYKDIQMAFLASAVLLYIFSYQYGIEYQSEMDVLLRTCYLGRGRTVLAKAGLGALITTIIYCVTYLPLYIDVFQKYGLEGLNAPANSLNNLAKIPVGITILQYLILVSVMRYVGYLLIMCFLFWVSRYTKGVMLNCAISLLLISLPLAFAFVGVANAKYILFNPLLLGNIFGF